jgi:hypothetical protein
MVGKNNSLLQYEDVRRKLRIGMPLYRGMRSVPLEAIQGSVDRWRDFDRAFFPRQSFTESRWERVGQAHYDGISLPPVHLYQIGDVYFVMDGNHRVSVARSLGQEFIDAEVYEARTRIPVHTDLNPDALEIMGEKVDFLEETHIDQLRPNLTIEITVPGGYYRLLEHIRVHRYLQSTEWNREFSMDEAVAQWVDQVYLPVMALIRENRVLDDFPGRTETDLYLWLTEHLYYLREEFGPNINLNEAVREFATHYTPNVVKRFWHWVTVHLGRGEPVGQHVNGEIEITS